MTVHIAARAINNIRELEVLVEALLSLDTPVGFDIETGYTGEPFKMRATRPEVSEISGFSLANTPTNGWYVPLRHNNTENLDAHKVAEIMKPLLTSGRIVCHNAKFEIRFCERPVSSGGMGYSFTPLSDTMLESYVLQRYRRHGLKSLSEEVLGHEMNDIFTLFCDLFQVDKLTQKQKDNINCHELQMSSKLVSYGVEDSAVALGLHERHYPEVKNAFIFKLEMALLPVCVAMERVGIRYDWDLLSEEVNHNLEFQARLYEEVVQGFEVASGRTYAREGKERLNLGSPKQMADVLYLDYGLPITTKTPGGSLSTSVKTLEQFADEHPAVEKLLEYRALEVARNSFLIKYVKDFTYAKDNRAHPNMMQHGTFTGRFSVADPPYHSSPRERVYTLKTGGKYSFNFRNAIIAEPGWYFLYYDLSQAELRALAGESGDADLIDALNSGEDVHRRTASMMLRKPLDSVTDEDRMKGKMLNFAQVYGQQAPSLAKSLQISEPEAQGLLTAFVESMPAVSAWQEKARKEAVDTGLSHSRFGRQHKIWELTNAKQFAAGERIATNAPIQGAIGDYMKIAMVRAWKRLHAAGLQDDVRLMMNNHDSLTFEVKMAHIPSDIVDLLDPEVAFEVDGWPEMKADWAVGRRWGELRDLDDTNRGHDFTSIMLFSEDYVESEDALIAERAPVLKSSAPVSLDGEEVETKNVGLPATTAGRVIISCSGLSSLTLVARLAELLGEGNDEVWIELPDQKVLAEKVSCPQSIWGDIKDLLGPGCEIRAEVEPQHLEDVLS